jgi:hypothetical protein
MQSETGNFLSQQLQLALPLFLVFLAGGGAISGEEKACIGGGVEDRASHGAALDVHEKTSLRWWQIRASN